MEFTEVQERRGETKANSLQEGINRKPMELGPNTPQSGTLKPPLPPCFILWTKTPQTVGFFRHHYTWLPFLLCHIFLRPVFLGPQPRVGKSLKRNPPFMVSLRSAPRIPIPKPANMCSTEVSCGVSASKSGHVSRLCLLYKYEAINSTFGVAANSIFWKTVIQQLKLTNKSTITLVATYQFNSFQNPNKLSTLFWADKCKMTCRGHYIYSTLHRNLGQSLRSPSVWGCCRAKTPCTKRWKPPPWDSS